MPECCRSPTTPTISRHSFDCSELTNCNRFPTALSFGKMARQVAAHDQNFRGPAVVAIREGAAFDQRCSQRAKIIGTGGDEPRVPQAAAVIRIRRPLRGETCDALPIDRRQCGSATGGL